jgi:hypothetical protein
MINNAGLMPQAPLEQLKVDEWDGGRERSQRRPPLSIVRRGRSAVPWRDGDTLEIHGMRVRLWGTPRKGAGDRG